VTAISPKTAGNGRLSQFTYSEKSGEDPAGCHEGGKSEAIVVRVS